ncbi:MAG: Uma2 family endonuclease [Candidatus Tectomicrobia bacterium]|nr:Uma2 family endonuclease [Candidatus Tectomicrobia bacterium]
MALSTKKSETGAISGSIPPLENGDRLSRMEFERRYDAMTHLKKAELIEGIVYMPSPVRHRLHGRPHSHLMGWLIVYEAGTPGVQVGDNSTVRLDLDNEPQPDAILLVDPECGGQTRLSEDGYIEGAPELVVEVTASTASYDLHAKLNVYRRNGVREYVVWRVQDEAIDWFVLRDEQYEPLQPDGEGRFCSEVFPGLWLDPMALMRHDLTRVLTLVQEGVASPEHAAFLHRLHDASSA